VGYLTGDSSGDFLFAALYRAGFANQPHSVARGDGLQLRQVYISAAARGAPPDNKPTRQELANCLPYLARGFARLRLVRVLIGLGTMGFNAILQALGAHDVAIPDPRPKFGHNALYRFDKYAVIGAYHPSRQNTNTGRLTAARFDAVFENARRELTNR
jgi:uracil-DNA glycosylase family 4